MADRTVIRLDDGCVTPVAKLRNLDIAILAYNITCFLTDLETSPLQFTLSSERLSTVTFRQLD